MVYIAEITEPKVRMIALFMPSLVILLGVLFSHIVGYFLYWKITAIISIFPVVISLIIFPYLKESPLWLIAKERTEEGVENFRWFRGTDDEAEAELRTVLERQSEKPKISTKEIFDAVLSRAFIKPMVILIVIVLNVQLAGSNIFSFYSLDILKKAFKGNIDPFMMVIVIDCTRTVVAIGICVFWKLIPKKIALLASNFGNSISALGLIACFLTNYGVIWVPVLCLVIFISFSSAVGVIGWTFVPELLPSTARGFGSGLNSAVSYLMLFIMLKTTPDLLNTYGEVAMFASYGISTLICGLILCFILPETSGKTLQSIEDSYKKKKVVESVTA